MSGALDWSRVRGRLYRDSYSAAGYLLFVVIAVVEWAGYVRRHEAIYLLGPRKVAEPGFLAGDLSWSTAPPTGFLFDHLLAPVWSLFGDFTTVALGRLIAWALLCWSLTLLARAMRLPPWSVVAGFAIWMLSGQSIHACGSLIEGFQPKSFAYPLIFFALFFAIRGQVIRAGLAAGLATVFHIIIGGWGTVAVFAAMAIDRERYSRRELGRFLAATAPLILPFVLIVAQFHGGGLSGREQRMADEIYVTFAQPHCLDPTFFVSTEGRYRAVAALTLSILLLHFWSRRKDGEGDGDDDATRLVGYFVLAHVAIYLFGMVTGSLKLYGFLKLYPFQWANSLPALFLFVLTLAFCARPRFREPAARAVWIVAIVAALWMIDERDVLEDEALEAPGSFWSELTRGERSRYGSRVSSARREMYAWIRDNTPPDSLFVTPYLSDFWTYAGRDQVAAFRHPPHDGKILEWKERLEAINGFREFDERGFGIRPEITRNEGRLTVAQLVALRDRYGATHYLSPRARPELAGSLLFQNRSYSLYDLAAL